jgi:hypothetical protein
VLAEVAWQHEAHRLLVAAVAGKQERSATRRLDFQPSQITEEGRTLFVTGSTSSSSLWQRQRLGARDH